jgi:hypothetical protein
MLGTKILGALSPLSHQSHCGVIHNNIQKKKRLQATRILIQLLSTILQGNVSSQHDHIYSFYRLNTSDSYNIGQFSNSTLTQT